MEELPNNLKVNGDLILQESRVIRLNKNLVVKGYLNLNRTPRLQELPDGLIVHEDLSLFGSSVNKFGKDIKIKGNIYIDHKNLSLIPKDLTLMGDIYSK